MPLLPYMERPADTREGCKHRCTDAAMEYFKAEVMEMCHRENLYQIDLLHGSKNRVTEREYWAKRKGQAALDKENVSLAAKGEPPAPYGKYQNVFFTESEYAELKQEYPDCLERLIEEMSRYIASSGNDYVSHAATLYRWADRKKKENPKKGILDYSFKEGESL